MQFLSSGSQTEGRFMANVETLAALKSVNLDADFAAVTLTINGAFDKRIKELTSAIAEFDKRQNIVNATNDAKKLIETATAQENAAKKAISALAEKEAELARREAEIEAAIAKRSAEEAALAEKESAFDQKNQQMLKHKENTEKALAQRELVVTKAEAKIAADLEELKAQKTAFNEKLALLKV
jgi:hypothetical protein